MRVNNTTNIFFAIVVIYNTSINNSITCNNLERIHNHQINVIIVDNSIQDNNNCKIAIEKNYTYLSMNGNEGLSKAYNRALDYLKDEKGIVIWFDDDTNVTQEYFDVLANAAKNAEIDIFAPVIMGQDGKLWSPNRARFFKNRQLKKTNEDISDEEFNAINSCMAVRLEVYRNYRYDESLFLDQVDHKFCRDQRAAHRHFMKLDCVIHHNFSTKSKMSSYEAVKTRYEIMIPDFMTYCSVDWQHYSLGLVKVLGWGIREGMKYHHLDFIPWCFGEVNKWRVNKPKKI